MPLPLWQGYLAMMNMCSILKKSTLINLHLAKRSFILVFKRTLANARAADKNKSFEFQRHNLNSLSGFFPVLGLNSLSGFFPVLGLNSFLGFFPVLGFKFPFSPISRFGLKREIWLKGNLTSTCIKSLRQQNPSASY